MCGGNDSSTAGMWSGDIPVCTGEKSAAGHTAVHVQFDSVFFATLCILTSAITCLPLTEIANDETVEYNNGSPNGNGMLPFEAIGTYRCETGFAPEGGAPVTRTCSADMSRDSGGSFDGVEAICVCKYIKNA